MRFQLVIIIFLFLIPETFSAQKIPTPVVAFDFNDHTYDEKQNKITTKPVAISLVSDRFGNEQSAVYMHGHLKSYLNLGTSQLMKPKIGTIALWIKLDRIVYSGKGYESNPILVTKNSNNVDFYDAYNLFYDFKTFRLMAFSTKDSTLQAGINSVDSIHFGDWFHTVVTYNNDSISLFINGKFQQSAEKKFETVFVSTDSVMVGNGASKKNDRCMRGAVDDIMFFDRVLYPEEILQLYNIPDHNKLKRVLKEVARYAFLIALVALFVWFIVWRQKRKMKQENERLELQKHVAELEMKVVKNQMNPHFISNCLAAIQDLIYNKEIEKAAQYVAKFSYFLRKVLDYSERPWLTLKEELEIIEMNIELEKLRFKNSFDFILKIDEKINTEEIMIPSLITQPLIENAIWHGLLSLNETRKPTLTINVFSDNDNIQLEITDNGPGRKENVQKERKSRGTRLVQEKLQSVNKLTNSNKYNMHIVDLRDENNEAVGTRVILQLDNQTETT